MFAKEYIDNKTDEELFESKEDINSDILNSEAYRIRSEEYTLNYFHKYLENKTPQELVLSFSDLPSVVQKSRYCTDKLKHLSKKDKSEIVALKELRETMKKLKLSKSKESRDQQKILAASVSSLEFGVP